MIVQLKYALISKNEFLSGPRVSIVIPCYNHGKYISDTIQSIERISDNSLYEIIIINDGSTDISTNDILSRLSEDGYNVIFQKNAGLATARNNGISIARGDYILPVDADNMIRPEYVEKGITVLDNNPDISIVYGNAQKFGVENEILLQGPYNLQKLMISNYIDACAIFRRNVWESNSGYDRNMPYTGIEDWDLWLNASFNGFKFHYINEVLFDYRVLPGSMIKNLKNNKKKGDANQDYLIKKYPSFFGPQYIDADIMYKLDQSTMGFIGKLILKKYFPSIFTKKVNNGKLRKYI